MNNQHGKFMFVLSAIAILLVFFSIAIPNVTAEDAKSPLKINLSQVKSVTYTKNNIPMNVVFTNTGGEDIKILRLFKPIPVFFTFNVFEADGTPVTGMPGGGKVSLRQDQLGYLRLSKNELFGFQVNVAEIVPPNLKPGKYNFSVTYHNQYGEDCFKGQVSSLPIEVNIEE